MKYAWLIIGVFAARFFATAIAFPQVDGDLSWQRFLGRTIVAQHAIPRSLGTDTFTAAGAPWTPQEWLFSLGAAIATGDVGWAFFAGGVAACAVAALAIGAWHAVRRGACVNAVALCLVFTGLALFASFGVRVQVAAWPLLALYLFLLDIDGPWAFAAIAVAAVWSNVHASAMLAPVLAAIAAVGTFVDDRGASVAVRRRALVALGSAVAICANPFGIDLPRYALALFASPFKSQISEWHATDLGDLTFVIGALPLLLLACVAFAPGGGRRARDVALLVTFAYLLLGAVRNVALFGIVALPLVAPALTRAFAFFAKSAAPSDARAERIANVALPVFGLVLAVVVGAGLLRNGQRTHDDLARRAVASVSSLPGERRLFCADFAWCGLAVGVPRVRVFLDGRADPYPLAVWTDFDAIARVRPTWRATLDRYAVNTVVVATDAPLDRMLAHATARDWYVSYRDSHFRVWVRSPGLAVGSGA
ncbi:MAG: hypothetical protein NVS1B2_23820 [Vulcanimicrobiaceae bacterium]